MEKPGTEKEKGLRIQLFHDFSLVYDGKPILFSRSSNTKFIPLLALLFLDRNYQAPKKELLDNLYGTGAVVNRNKSLNSVIYRLNDWLRKQGIPAGNGVAMKEGMVFWRGDIPVWVDVIDFERKTELAQSAKTDRTEALEAAETAYQGEILGEFSTELWVITKNMQYKKLYEEIALELEACFFQRGEYLKAAAVCRRAASLYPFEDWQLREIDCLQAVSEYDMALEVYRRTEKLYFDELGLNPGRNMMERLKSLEERQLSRDRNLDMIGEKLFTEQTGAACVAYPSFLEISRYCGRIAERNGKPYALMLITLERRKQSRSLDRETLSEYMERLKGILCATIRESDVFTKSSENQFLILIEGREEAGVEIFGRLMKKWKAQPGGNGQLRYSVLSLWEMRQRFLRSKE